MVIGCRDPEEASISTIHGSFELDVYLDIVHWGFVPNLSLR